MKMNLIHLSKSDISIGKPLPWTLYDQRHSVLLEQGSVVSDNDHLDKLLAQGACHELVLEIPTNGNGKTLFDAGVNSEHLKPLGSRSHFTFDDMRLKTEDRLQLHPPAQMASKPFLVKVIGFLRGHSLLVTSPVIAPGTWLRLLEGETVNIRSFSGQNAFAFTCTIERTCKQPYEYLHLSFPDAIEGVVIREAPRVKTNIITAARISDCGKDDGNVTALISNLSSSGAALDARQILGNEGDILNLSFCVYVHNTEVYLTLQGKIRNVLRCHTADISEPDMVRHGIEFQNIQLSDAIILKSMVYQQLIENPHILV